jgi:hypothetical protein
MLYHCHQSTEQLFAWQDPGESGCDSGNFFDNRPSRRVGESLLRISHLFNNLRILFSNGWIVNGCLSQPGQYPQGLIITALGRQPAGGVPNEKRKYQSNASGNQRHGQDDAILFPTTREGPSSAIADEEAYFSVQRQQTGTRLARLG